MNTMKRILIFGAGKSSSYLIDYLGRFLQSNNWRLLIADANLAAAQAKIAGIPNTEAVAVDVMHNEQRKELIASAEIIISLLPPTLHYLVADANGNVATIEFLDGKMVVHRGSNLPFTVLTKT